MTESEWLSSEDPAAMLRLAMGRVSLCCGCVWCGDGTSVWLADGQKCCRRCDNTTPSKGYREISSIRKLRLFACASIVEPVRQAALLRDIVGNPFRPVTLPKTRRVEVDAWDGGPAGYRMECPWLTPQVVSLAQIAYDERPGRKCERCKGTGREWVSDQEELDRMHQRGEHPFVPPMKRIKCRECHGTGTVSGGTLDAVTLAVLADALEEAGCPAETTDRLPVDVAVYPEPPHGWTVQIAANWLMPKSPRVAHREKRRNDAVAWAEKNLEAKWDSKGERSIWGKGFDVSKRPNPILAHLRSPGPHVRGCWALDCVRGVE